MQLNSSSSWYLACVGLHGVVPHAASAVYLAHPTWVSGGLAHAGGLQWPTPLGPATAIGYPRRASTYPRKPPTPNSSHSKVAGWLYGLSQGTSCLLAGHPTSSTTKPPLPHYQGLGYHPGCRTPLG